MSKTWRRGKKKWYDDDYDRQENQRRVKKSKKHHKNHERDEESLDLAARQEFPGAWRGNAKYRY